MNLRNTITRVIDGRRITMDHGTVALVEARRANLRGASPRTNALGLTKLRSDVAERLGISQRDAGRLLSTVRYGDLFVS